MKKMWKNNPTNIYWMTNMSWGRCFKWLTSFYLYAIALWSKYYLNHFTDEELISLLPATQLISRTVLLTWKFSFSVLSSFHYAWDFPEISLLAFEIEFGREMAVDSVRNRLGSSHAVHLKLTHCYASIISQKAGRKKNRAIQEKAAQTVSWNGNKTGGQMKLGLFSQP